MTMRAICWRRLCNAGLILAGWSAGVGAVFSAESVAPAPDKVANAATPEAHALELYWQAMDRFRGPTSESQEQGRSLLLQSADLDCREAASLLGSALLSESYGFKQDPAGAVRRFEQAIKLGDDFARVGLAECYVRGIGVKVDAGEAEKLLRMALAPETTYPRPAPPAWFLHNDSSPDVAGELEYDAPSAARAYAHHLYGLIEQQRGNLAAAQEHFITASQSGRAGRAGVFEAAVQAAMNCAFGRGVPRDRAQAMALLEHARDLRRRQGAQQVHGMAMQGALESFAAADLEQSLAENSQRELGETQFGIAQHFADAASAEHDPGEARAWYELAAGNNQVDAMIALALMDSRGATGPPDRAAALGWLQRAGGGDPVRSLHAAACLGICYLHGLGTPVDPAKATAIFARHRDEDFVCYLGTIGKAPADVLSADEARAMLEAWAEKNRDVHAQFLLAEYHLWGCGYPADAKEGVRLLKLAADHGSGEACGVMGDYYAFVEGNAKKAEDYYGRGLRRNDARSEVGLARLRFQPSRELFNQQDIDELSRALDLCEKALNHDPDFVPAHELEMSICMCKTLRRDKGTGKFLLGHYDVPRARSHARRADELGSALAAYYLGSWALEGNGESKDPRKAYDLFSIAAERGLAVAHLQLGAMHADGIGVPVTLDEAAYHYRLAALGGNAEGARRLANMYIGGHGVAANEDRAVFWYSVAARSGEPASNYELAKILMRLRRYPDAVAILEKIAAGSGGVFQDLANLDLARCYRMGLGVTSNAKKARDYRAAALAGWSTKTLLQDAKTAMGKGPSDHAVELYTLAAEVFPEASYSLGQMYFFGQNVAADRNLSVSYLRFAAEYDYADALYFLAAMTVKREAGAPSVPEAREFARRAVKAGLKKAEALLLRLEALAGGPSS